MPIKKENRHLYPEKKEWRRLRQAAVERSRVKWMLPGDERCFRCGARNHSTIHRGQGIYFEWHSTNGYIGLDDTTGAVIGGSFHQTPTRQVQVVLTLAHVDQDPTNNTPENLELLCQQCHNRLDAPHRAKHARETRDAKQVRMF